MYFYVISIFLSVFIVAIPKRNVLRYLAVILFFSKYLAVL